MPINVSLRSALIIQGLWGTERGRLARRSSVGAEALFPLQREMKRLFVCVVCTALIGDLFSFFGAT